MTAEEIYQIRASLGVSQEKFAQMLGTTVVSVNRWESGRVTPSRLYIKEIKELKKNHGSYASRREKS
jgi:DNA-binding transcriptional regulator YiaG